MWILMEKVEFLIMKLICVTVWRLGIVNTLFVISLRGLTASVVCERLLTFICARERENISSDLSSCLYWKLQRLASGGENEGRGESQHFFLFQTLLEFSPSREIFPRFSDFMWILLFSVFFNIFLRRATPFAGSKHWRTPKKSWTYKISASASSEKKAGMFFKNSTLYFSDSILAFI